MVQVLGKRRIMADVKTKEQRSFNMSRVRAKETNLEIKIQVELHKIGLIFETNVSDLPGKPDIIFRKEQVAIFIDGDFWHGYRFPQWKNTQSPFWQKKINDTRKRDQRNFRKLRRMGWKVIRIWQHQIKIDLGYGIKKITSAITNISEASLCNVYSVDEK
jgi:DNA mismatch endonuclease, patch repair protein